MNKIKRTALILIVILTLLGLANFSTIDAAEVKITASDAAADDRFGISVSISGDYAIVGAYQDDDGGAISGSAYIFKRNGTNWSQQAKITAIDAAAGDEFGWSVSISGDYAIVGAYHDDDGGGNSGSAYIFYRNQGGADNWGQQAKLTAGDAAADDYFGFSVSINGDYAIVGAHQDDDDGFNSGSAHIFYRNQGGADNWGQQSKLTAGDAAVGDVFGNSVSISGDYAIVGAYGNDDTGGNSGSAYIFYRNQGGADNWGQQLKLTAGDAAADDYFGISVSINGDYAITGAYDDDGGFDAGSAYIFYRNEGGVDNWGQQSKLTAGDAAAFDEFGHSVSISGDSAIIGAHLNDDAGEKSGSAYIFKRNGTNWSQQSKLTASNAAADDKFGYSVSISGDYTVVGSLGDDDDGNESGSAYIFYDAPPSVANAIPDVTVDEDANDTIIDLTNVFSDLDNDDALITKAVQSNTNAGLVSASIVGNTLTLDYQDNQTGTAAITIRATSNGKTVDDDFTVTVNAVDDAPTVANAISDVTVDEDANNTTIDLTNVFSDVDNDDALITKAVQSNTNAALVSASIVGNTLTLDYQDNQNGTAAITIRATSNGKTVDDDFTVTVNAVDDAPTVANAISDVTVDEDANNTTIDLTNVFSDVDNDDALITKAVQSNTNAALVSASIVGNTLTLDYQDNQNGTAAITIRATSNGKTVDDDFTVTVNAVNDAPTVANAISDVTVDEDANNTTIDLTNVFSDVDNDDALITKAVQSNTNAALVSASIVGNTLTLDYQDNKFGTASITIRGISNGQTVDDVFNVIVNAVDDAPTVANAISDVTVDEDANNTTIDLTNVFSDLDNDDALITKAVQSNTNAGLVSVSIVGNTLTLDYQDNQTGAAAITIRATSNGKTVDDDFNVTVNAVNDAPTVANAISDVTVDEDADDTTIDLTNVFSDLDNDDALITKAVQSNTNAGLVSASIVGNTLTLDYQDNQNGTAAITIRATSNGKTVDDDFNVTVNSVNDLPSISDIADQSTNKNTAADEISFTIGDVETSSSSLTLTGSSSDTTTVSNSNIIFGGSGSNRTVIITPSMNKSGNITITITVSDGIDIVSGTFILTVYTRTISSTCEVLNMLQETSPLVEGWLMISPPVLPNISNDPESVFGDDVSPFQTYEQNSHIYYYNEQTGQWTVPSIIQNGIGYILYCYRNNILDVSGLEVNGDVIDTLTYTNNNGWHLSGNPYSVTIDWDSDITRDSGIDNIYYVWTGSYYDNYPYGGLTRDIDAWQGFWVHTTTDNAELTISYPGLSKKAVTKRPLIDWRIKVIAESGENSDVHNYIGISDDSEVGYDAADVFELVPLNQEFVSLYFPHTDWSVNDGNFTQDIRPQADDKMTWDFVVAANSNSENVTLRWEIPDELDADMSVILMVDESGEQINMRENSYYTYTILPSLKKPTESALSIGVNPSDLGQRLKKENAQLQRFSITIEKKSAAVIPDEYYVNQNYPNPFNPSTTIEYGLKETGNVSLRIFNILGQEIASLLNKQVSAGKHEVLWDGMDDNGINVSSGIYFYKISVNDFQEIKKLILLR